MSYENGYVKDEEELSKKGRRKVDIICGNDTFQWEVDFIEFELLPQDSAYIYPVNQPIYSFPCILRNKDDHSMFFNVTIFGELYSYFISEDKELDIEVTYREQSIIYSTTIKVSFLYTINLLFDSIDMKINSINYFFSDDENMYIANNTTLYQYSFKDKKLVNQVSIYGPITNYYYNDNDLYICGNTLLDKGYIMRLEKGLINNIINKYDIDYPLVSLIVDNNDFILVSTNNVNSSFISVDQHLKKVEKVQSNKSFYYGFHLYYDNINDVITLIHPTSSDKNTMFRVVDNKVVYISQLEMDIKSYVEMDHKLHYQKENGYVSFNSYIDYSNHTKEEYQFINIREYNSNLYMKELGIASNEFYTAGIMLKKIRYYLDTIVCNYNCVLVVFDKINKTYRYIYLHNDIEDQYAYSSNELGYNKIVLHDKDVYLYNESTKLFEVYHL